MLKLDWPGTWDELAGRRYVTMRHDLLDLTTGLEPGQVLVAYDYSGAARCVEVLRVHIDETQTRYRLVVGGPVTRAVASIVTTGRAGVGAVGVADVVDALRSLSRPTLVPCD